MKGKNIKEKKEKVTPEAETEKIVNEENETQTNDEEQAPSEIELKVADLEKRCAESEQKIAETNDKYLRLAAEFDNYRRRSAKERLDLIATAGEDVIVGFLPILDDCERALDVLRKSDVSEAAIEGTELIMNKLFGYLKTKGVAKIEAVGKELDTDFHEAAAQFPVEDKKKVNTIIDVIQNGYTLHGKVIRFAKVVVGI